MAQGIVGEFFDLSDATDADLLAMQVGDFYEFFGSDAETVADELDLKISQKSAGGESYPMAGVPVDDLTPYLTALVERGYRVAVADQTETDDGHVRELDRVVSPGTLVEATDADARYLAAVVDADVYGLAFADVTTGQFYVTTAEDIDTLLSELYRFDPVELLPGPTVRNDDTLVRRFHDNLTATVTLYDTDAFAPGQARHTLADHFGKGAIESLGLKRTGPAVQAGGAVLGYIAETGAGVLASFTRLQRARGDDQVTLDATTRRNLELTETMQGGTDGSLFATIDRTVTSVGRRRLQEWLLRPTRDRDQLKERLDAVEALTNRALAREQLRERLSAAYDLPRLASKAAHGSAGPGDLLRVRETLTVLPTVAEVIADDDQLASSPLSNIIDRPDHERAATLRDTLETALRSEPAGSPTDGPVIAEGYDDTLDAVLERHDELTAWFDSLAATIREEHGLRHVTVDRNKTDGYYIQVGKSAADAVPDGFREIKTLKNSKRFVTDELEARERELVELEQRRAAIEADLFASLREEVAAAAALLQAVGRALSTIDALAGLATHAADRGWTRPTLGSPGGPIAIEAGRHPVVETTTEFVPNDARLDDDRQFLIVTGPNMSGKSTYMRQVALIVLLTQIGSFVPAAEARIGPVDGIFTRVGALDELAQGRSTFMVEMEELSRILHAASDQSLVILDEVGRGTATYDGMSIAWSTTEYLHNKIAAKTLFATHYHELTAIGDHLDGVHNVHVAADERDGDVTFLRTIQEGPTDRSYGIHVADLAGVPTPVVDRARTVLDRLRDEKAIEAKGSGDDGPTQVVFDLDSGQVRGADEDVTPSLEERFGEDTETVLEAIADLDVASTAPLELMSTVQEWQRRLETGER